METKSAQTITSDAHLLALIHLIKKGDQQAMSDIIELYQKDILWTCKYIAMPREDAMQWIITDFLEYLKNHDDTEYLAPDKLIA